MSKGVIIGMVIAALALVGGSVLLAQNDNSNDKTTDSNSSQDMSNMDTSNDTTGSSSGSSNSSEATATDKVDITNYAFSPANITVKVGTTVTWTNKDAIGHTVTSDDGSDGGMDSKVLNQGDTYTMTFSKAGTFPYHCTPHPYMKGTVTVTE
jgi:amicyanin